MSIAAVVVITCCLAALPILVIGGWFEESRDPNLSSDALIARVKELSGPGAKFCGEYEHKRGQALTLPRCVTDAFQKKEAFWTVEHGYGQDSLIWSGLAGDNRGRIWTVILDTDVSGSNTWKPAMAVFRCVNATMNAGLLDCENWHTRD